MAAADFVTIARVEAVPPGHVRVVEHGGRRYAVCNAEGVFRVIADTCSHDDGPLGEGTLAGHAVVCPRHGARFDIRTGQVLQMPAVFPIRVYETRVDDGNVQIRLESRSTGRK